MLPQVNSISQPAAALSNLALITPNTNYGYHAFNALTGASTGPSFLFTYELENKVRLDAEFPDSWLENNTSIQDHAVIKPEIIMVRGAIGEVTFIAPPLFPVLGQVQSALTLISTFAPGFSRSAMNTINDAEQAYNEAAAAVNGGVQAWANLTGSGVNVVTGQGENQSISQNQQQQMFSRIYGFWRQQVNQAAPVLWTVQTPWAVFSPVGLMSAEITQGEDSENDQDPQRPVDR